MDKAVHSNKKEKPSRVNHQKEYLTVDRLRFLLSDLDNAVMNLHHRFPDVSFVIEDRYGVTVRTVRGVQPDSISPNEWESTPLSLNQREFGRIRYAGPLGDLSSSDIIPIVLSLTELENWAQIEGERRGEKVQKVLSDGVTPEVVRLLSQCGLHEFPGYTLVAMELTSQTDKFLYMDLLRRFMLARIWGYRDSFDFVAYRPGGLLTIFPECNAQRASQNLKRWLEQWNQFQSGLELAQKMEIRACVTTVDTLYQLDSALREIEVTMQFADRWNLVGLIRPRVNQTLAYTLSHLPENKIIELVQCTLGPLLISEHSDLLHTLRVYLSLDQNVTEAAKALYVHRNTLLYRIRHIEQLLGMKLRNTAHLSAVWSALEGLELLESSGYDLFRHAGRPSGGWGPVFDPKHPS